MRRIVSVLVVATLFLLSTSQYMKVNSQSCNWEMFRFNLQHTGTAPDSCAPKSDSFEVLWKGKFPVGGWVGEPSSAIYDQCLFLGSREKMICLDIANGQQKWSFKTGGAIESTPTIYKGKVYFTCNDGYFYCLDQNSGDEFWSFKESNLTYCSPLAINNRVFFQDSMYDFQCLDSETGKIVWKTDENIAGGVSSPSVSVDGNYIYFGIRWGMVCIKSSDGSLVWKFETKDEIKSTPAIEGEKIVFGCNDGNVYCINSISGSKIWSYRTENEVESSPCIYNKKVYIGTKDGYFACLDLNTGKLVWKFASGDKEYSSAIACNKKIYFGGDSSHIYVLDSDNGNKIWSYFSTEKDEFLSQPVISNGKLFISSEGYSGGTYCFAESTPKKAKKIVIDQTETMLGLGDFV